MKLSQAEIDALFHNHLSSPPAHDRPLLDEAECDMLGEIGNISFGSAATSLSALLQQRVEITTPRVSVVRSDQLDTDMARPYVMVMVDFTAGLFGANALAVEIQDAKTIADLMLGGDGRNVSMELNELHLSAVAEAMNQMMGGAATALSTMLNRPVNISPPKTQVVDLSAGGEIDLAEQVWLVKTAFRLRVGDLIDSNIMQLVPISFARELLSLLRGEAPAETAATTAPAAAPAAPPAAPPVVGGAAPVNGPPKAARAPSGESGPGADQTLASQVSGAAPASGSGMPLSAGVNQGRAGVAATPAKQSASVPELPPVPVQRPEFVEFAELADTHAGAPAPRNLSLLLDVLLEVTVELGKTRMSIREILDLTPGAVIELEKLAGEPVDILVNNKRIAIGEVVVIDENFGVRVTDIL
ncbi:MAG: flagellar motor switch phosphatase FliY, partial [Alicyclobacillus sp.]|nr:flagellar motor switch phosphatase FliY [Alicyclobacillus sp.]